MHKHRCNEWEIEALLKECLELKDRKQCPKCHTELELNAKFCVNCGEKQLDAEVKDAEVITKALEDAEIKPENETEKEIIEEKVAGEYQEQKENVIEIENSSEENNNN